MHPGLPKGSPVLPRGSRGLRLYAVDHRLRGHGWLLADMPRVAIRDARVRRGAPLRLGGLPSRLPPIGVVLRRLLRRRFRFGGRRRWLCMHGRDAVRLLTLLRTLLAPLCTPLAFREDRIKARHGVRNRPCAVLCLSDLLGGRARGLSGREKVQGAVQEAPPDSAPSSMHRSAARRIREENNAPGTRRGDPGIVDDSSALAATNTITFH